jgi:hypothetical protein
VSISESTHQLASSDSRRILFTFLVSLIDINDDHWRIDSYQQHTYLYLHYCLIKYNIYLLYQTRARHPFKNYSIRVDVYEKISLACRGTFFIPVQFAFLPVNRIVAQRQLPSKGQAQESCVDPSCVHNRCIRYVDDRFAQQFRQCEQTWYRNSCPVDRWGSRCLPEHDACQPDPHEKRLNGGRCVPDEQQLAHDDKFLCTSSSYSFGFFPRCYSQLPHSASRVFLRPIGREDGVLDIIAEMNTLVNYVNTQPLFVNSISLFIFSRHLCSV